MKFSDNFFAETSQEVCAFCNSPFFILYKAQSDK